MLIRSIFDPNSSRCLASSVARRQFLSSRWHNIVIASWQWVSHLLPFGTMHENATQPIHVSLMAFECRKTRVYGVRCPGCSSFPVWRLVASVQRGRTPCVTVLSEFQSSRTMAWMKRMVYHEPSFRVPILSIRSETRNTVQVEYVANVNGKSHRMMAIGAKPEFHPTQDELSKTGFDAEWGLGRTATGTGQRYRFSHPKWSIYPVSSHSIDVDWGALYGGCWEQLNGVEPESVLLVSGSEVGLSWPEKSG